MFTSLHSLIWGASDAGSDVFREN